MTLIELQEKLAAEAQVTKAAAGRMIDFIKNTIVAELLVEGKSQFPGLGIFRVVTRKARAYRNPQTGAQVDKEERQAVKFKPLAEIKRRLNG